MNNFDVSGVTFLELPASTRNQIPSMAVILFYADYSYYHDKKFFWLIKKNINVFYDVGNWL